MKIHLVSSWSCQGCEQTGAGTMDQVNRAATKHIRDTQHATVTSHRPEDT